MTAFKKTRSDFIDKYFDLIIRFQVSVCIFYFDQKSDMNDIKDVYKTAHD